MKTFIVFLLTLLVPAFSAQAALVTVDSSAGPGTAVLDTSTGKTWLKLSVTAGLTPDEVFAAIAPGGRFESFRYPAYDELTCGLLGANAGLACPNWTTFNVDPVWELFSAFGLSGRPRPPVYHTLSTFGEMPEQYIFGSAFYYYTEPRPEFDFDSQQVLLNTSRLNQRATHWLVRDVQDIPAPSTPVLLAIGASGLALHRSRRKHRGLPAAPAASRPAGRPR
jgi:hypothetical protein